MCFAGSTTLRKRLVAWLRRPRYRLGCLLAIPVLVAGACWLRVKTAPWSYTKEDLCRACLSDIGKIQVRPFGDWFPLNQEWTRSTPGSRLLAQHFAVRCRKHEGIPPMSGDLEREVEDYLGVYSGLETYSWNPVRERERQWDDRVTALFAKVPYDEDEDRALLIASLVQPDWQAWLSIRHSDPSGKIWQHLVDLSRQQPPAEIREFQDLLPKALTRSEWRSAYQAGSYAATAELVARR